MKVTDKQQILLLCEVKRLSKAIRDKDAPEGAADITAIIIDMLVTYMLGKLSQQEFIEILESEPLFKDVKEYYVLFFIAVNSYIDA